MAGEPRLYRYVGPAHVRQAMSPGSLGRPIRSLGDLQSWAAASDALDLAEPHTFVVDRDGVLRVAPRRSEHVACAGGGHVRGAGEITFTRDSDGWHVVEVSNQSTGYCPDVTSWPAVAAALDRAGLRHPDQFTSAFIFRRCTACGERNIVKDDDFSCAVCGDELPASWNLDAAS